MGITVADPLGNHHPPAKDNPVAWIQVAAVSKSQTQNTMRVFPTLFTAKATAQWQIDIGAARVNFLAGARIIQAVTRNPAPLQGARATFVIGNESHEWLETNNGMAMLAVLTDNATKAPDGAARILWITNAYNPNQGSVAQMIREAYEAEEGGDSVQTGILYDSLEAPEKAHLSPPKGLDMAIPEHREDFVAYLTRVIEAVRGDSVWLQTRSIVRAILDRKNPVSRMRRMWFNQIVTAEDAWVDRDSIRAARHPYARQLRENVADQLRATWRLVEPTDPVVIFFDGSKSDDETALVGCRLSDGFVFTLGVWFAPPKDRKHEWRAPRSEVDARVKEVVGTKDATGRVRGGRFKVVAFWGDPGHIKEDDDDSRYWDGLFDEWHRDYKEILQTWAVQTGHNLHSIRWDMTNELRNQVFTEAAETTVAEIERKDEDGLPAPAFFHDGYVRLEKHLMNARKATNKWGTSLRKAGRESPAKIDLAVCMVGARLLRRLTLNRGLEKTKGGRSGGWTNLG
jgi:hypothetical protein